MELMLVALKISMSQKTFTWQMTKWWLVNAGITATEWICRLLHYLMGKCLNSNKIFSSEFINNNPNLNNSMRNSNDNEYIYKFDDNKKDLCYSVNSANTAYNLNCVIAMGNPFFLLIQKRTLVKLLKI